MSRPPKPEVIGAFDRPDHPQRFAVRTGPARQRRRAGFAQLFDDFGLDRREVAVELVLVFADLGQRRFAIAAGVEQRRLAALQRRPVVDQRCSSKPAM